MNLYEIACHHLGFIRVQRYTISVTYDGPTVAIVMVDNDKLLPDVYHTLRWIKWQSVLREVALAQWGEQANLA